VSKAGELYALAERCEQATGPDRELDCEILVAIDWRYDDWEEGERTAKEMAEKHGLAWLVSRSVEGYNSTWRHLPRLTASLDAAMTLRPDARVILNIAEDDLTTAIVGGTQGVGDTPALASAGETQRAETPKSGSVEDEHATGEAGDAQKEASNGNPINPG
jgi:hypothetical protein